MDSITDFLNRLLVQPARMGESITILQALGAFFLAYAGGLLSSLTPCVYPMIPITVGVVGGVRAGEKTGWRQVWTRGLIYVLGMAVVYSFLGVLAGLTGKVFGSMTNTVGWYLALGLIMTFAALIMLDVVPFDPVSLWERTKHHWRRIRGGERQAAFVSREHREVTWVGAFVLGASSGLVAAPCTTPILAAILAYIAKTQSIGLGLLLMFAFSAGLGTLLLIIAGFAGALRVLPRSGDWMKRIKILSGLILLAFADYLIYRAGKLGGF